MTAQTARGFHKSDATTVRGRTRKDLVSGDVLAVVETGDGSLARDRAFGKDCSGSWVHALLFALNKMAKRSSKSGKSKKRHSGGYNRELRRQESRINRSRSK